MKNFVKEFEAVLAEADRLYDEIEKSTIEDGISRRKQFARLTITGR